MHLKCWIGWHKWLYADFYDEPQMVTLAQCSRKDCQRYPKPMIVNIDYIPARPEGVCISAFGVIGSRPLRAEPRDEAGGQDS